MGRGFDVKLGGAGKLDGGFDFKGHVRVVEGFLDRGGGAGVLVVARGVGVFVDDFVELLLGMLLGV